MANRKKRLEKQIKSLNQRSKDHLEKIDSEGSASMVTKDYWLKESKLYEKQAKEKEEMLKKLGKK